MLTRSLIATKKQIMVKSEKGNPSKNLSNTYLRYYLLTSNTDHGLIQYGVGIEKITEKNGVTHSEKEYICDIFIKKDLCCDFLNCLIRNVVFPTNLKDIVQDTIA